MDNCAFQDFRDICILAYIGWNFVGKMLFLKINTGSMLALISKQEALLSFTFWKIPKRTHNQLTQFSERGLPFFNSISLTFIHFNHVVVRTAHFWRNFRLWTQLRNINHMVLEHYSCFLFFIVYKSTKFYI